MSNKIKIKRSAIEGKVPVVADLELGELAINTYDGRLFLKKDVSGVESIVDINNTAADAISTLNLLKTVDGTGSGLDADLLDGLTTSSTNIADTVMTRNEDGQTGISVIAFDASSTVSATGKVFLDGSDYFDFGSSIRIPSGKLAVGTDAVSTTGATAVAHFSGNLKIDSAASFVWDGTYPSSITGYSGADGVGKIEINAGNSSTPFTVEYNGLTTVLNTTQSTAYTNGALIVSGGVGVAKNLNVNGDATINNLTLGGYLRGPSSFTIDPSGYGDNTGTVIIKGNLQIDGTTTTLNSTVLEVTDKNMILGNVSTPSDATADGGGITLKGTTDKTFNWVDATDAWTSSEHLAVVGGKNLRILGSSSGTIDLAAPAVAGSTTITFPATTGTVVTTGDTQTVTTAMMTTSGVSAATYGDAQNVAQFTVDVAGRITSAANVPIPKTIPVYTRTAQILVSAASGYVNVYGRSATTVVPLLV